MASANRTAERVRVYLRGVPLGTFALSGGDLVLAPLEREPGYDSFATVIRAASEPLWQLGFLHPPSPRIAAEALAPPRELAFELRDMDGRQLHADFVNVVASPASHAPPTVVVHRKHANAAIASVLGQVRRAPGEPGAPPPDGGR